MSLTTNRLVPNIDACDATPNGQDASACDGANVPNHLHHPNRLHHPNHHDGHAHAVDVLQIHLKCLIAARLLIRFQ